MDPKHLIAVKVSGGFLKPHFKKKILEIIGSLTLEACVTVIVGGGEQISGRFSGRNHSKDFTPFGRILPRELEPIRKEALEANRDKLQQWLNNAGITATVDIPSGIIGGMEYPQNADIVAVEVALYFDAVIIITDNAKRKTADPVLSIALQCPRLAEKIKLIELTPD